MISPHPTSTLFPYTTLFRSTSHTTRKRLAVDAVPITDEVLRRALPTTCLGDLTGDPFGSRMRSRSEEHTSELQSRVDLVCRLPLEKKKRHIYNRYLREVISA